MRIAYIAPRYYPHLGGVEYVVRNFAERLASRGNEVTVISGEPDIRKTVIEEVNKVEVVRIPTYAPREAYHVPKDRQTIARILRDDLDIVHTHSVHAAISFVPLRIKRSNKPNWKLIMTMHFSTQGYTFLRRVIWRLAWKRFVTQGLGSVDWIHATSPFEAEFVAKHFPSVKDRIITVPIGVEEDVLSYSWRGKDSDYFLYCGRLERYKRVDLIVRAVARLVKLGYRVRLVVTGSGPYKGKIIDEAKRVFGRSIDCFICAPPKPRRKYLELLSDARAAVSLSVAENFNIFLAEAHVMGVPIIATREAVPFCSELANVEALGPAHVAEVMLKMLHPHEYDEHSGCTLKTWQDVAKDLEDLYKGLV